jgi:AcrR family transcriptional regulator
MTGSDDTPPRVRARRSDSVRNEALVRSAASEVFGELGVELTHSAVAARAGVGRATVYRTFPTRASLIAAMCDDRVAWVRVQLEHALALDDAWLAQVELAHTLMERLRVDRGLDQVLSPRSEFEAQFAVLEPLFERFLARVKETGRIRPDVTGIDMGNLMSGLANSLHGRRDDDPASWHRAADLVLAACGTYPPALGADN